MPSPVRSAFQKTAQEMARQEVKKADDGDHFRLAFEREFVKGDIQFVKGDIQVFVLIPHRGLTRAAAA